MSRSVGAGDWVRLTRPGNVALGAVGVMAGGVAGLGFDVAWLPLALAATAAALGIAAANALNDVLDAALDVTAHPARPVAQGRLHARQALVAASVGFVAALVLAWTANAAAGMVATALVLVLAAYEAWLKRQGLPGNLAVSLVVGSTFILGAVAAAVGPLAYDTPRLQASVGRVAWDVVAPLALMAFMANVSREVFKDVEDLEADRGRRRSLPTRIGVRGARWVAGVVLVVASAFAIALFYAHPRFGDEYLLLVIPAVIAFMLSLAAVDGRVASRAVKVGMVFALLAFLAVGLL